MALSPQKFREMVFQILYSKDTGHAEDKSLVELMMGELSVSKKNVKVAHEKVLCILQKLPEIDPLIASLSTSYDFNRINTVAKNILRLGVYELLFDTTIPPKVAIAEAMRLARKFGSPESASFINALLDQLYKKQTGKPADSTLIQQQAEDYFNSEEAAQKNALDFETQQKTSIDENET